MCWDEHIRNAGGSVGGWGGGGQAITVTENQYKTVQARGKKKSRLLLCNVRTIRKVSTCLGWRWERRWLLLGLSLFPIIDERRTEWRTDNWDINRWDWHIKQFSSAGPIINLLQCYRTPLSAERERERLLQDPEAEGDANNGSSNHAPEPMGLFILIVHFFFMHCMHVVTKVCFLPKHCNSKGCKSEPFFLVRLSAPAPDLNDNLGHLMRNSDSLLFFPRQRQHTMQNRKSTKRLLRRLPATHLHSAPRQCHPLQTSTSVTSLQGVINLPKPSSFSFLFLKRSKFVST